VEVKIQKLFNQSEAAKKSVRNGDAWRMQVGEAEVA
jgi:hypothetical protein